MGYIPPPPGSIMILESSQKWIEVTSLEDDREMFVPRLPGHYLRMPTEESPHARLERIAKMEAITKRDAAIGAVLIVLLPLAVVACILQWTGVL